MNIYNEYKGFVQVVEHTLDAYIDWHIFLDGMTRPTKLEALEHLEMDIAKYKELLGWNQKD